MRYRALFAVAGLLLISGCCCCSGTSGPSTPATPESKAFGEADREIISYDAADGIGFGNTTEAKEFAVAFGELAAEMEPDWFSGGDEGALSLSDGHFLTYCRQNADSICFLVHVPQLKNYEGEVRESLIDMLWICADEVLTGKVDSGTEVAIGLRGTILYGGLAIGELGSEPSQKEEAGSVDREKFHRFFKEDEPPVETATEGDTASDATDAAADSSTESDDTAETPAEHPEENPGTDS